MQCTDKLLDLRTSYGALPPLGLKVHDVEPEAVLANDAVDSFITGLPDGLTRVAAGAPVTHLEQQLDDEALEKLRCASLDPCQELCC